MKAPFTRRGALVGVAAFAAAPNLGFSKTTRPAPARHDVRIKSFTYDPVHIDVRPGDTISWTNDDLAPHTATANKFGWDTGEIATGETKDIVVEAGMELDYFCVFHPHMTASIAVLAD